MLKITGADVVVAVYSVRPFHRATFDTVAWQTPTITFDTVLYVRCAPPPAVTFWGCTTSFMSPLSRIIREKFPLPIPPSSVRKIVWQSTFHIAVPLTFSAFIRWTRSNAPTSPIKVCPLLILINCGCKPFVNSYGYFWHYGRSIYWAIFCIKNSAEQFFRYVKNGSAWRTSLVRNCR